jgi:glycosyltransferase involved in cell wall biosynthesis
MRILIITTFFPPLNSIASLRPYSWAKYWSQEGHEVVVLTTPKNLENPANLTYPLHGFAIIEAPLPKWVNSLKQDYQQTTEGKLPSKSFRWVKKIFRYLRYRKGIFNACRMPDFSDFWINSALREVVSKGSWDLVVSTSGPYAVHCIAEKLKRKGLAKNWIADFRDLWSSNHIYPGLFPFNIVERWLEKKILKKADYLTTVSEPLAKQLKIQHPHQKVFVIENGFDPVDVSSSSPSIFPQDDRFRLVHTGSVYNQKQDPEPLFHSLSLLKANADTRHLLDRLEVIFVGPNLEHVSLLAEKYQVSDRVKFHGLVKRDDALQMQREAHLLLFLPWNDPVGVGAGVMSGKLFEYLYSGTPILAVGGQGMECSQELISDLKAGHVLPTHEQIVPFLTEKLQKLSKEKIILPASSLNLYNRQHLAMKLLGLSQ